MIGRRNPKRLIDATVALVVAAATFGATSSQLTAQTAARTTAPEIEHVDFRGVRSVPMPQVQRAVVTRASSPFGSTTSSRDSSNATSPVSMISIGVMASVR